MQQAGPRAHFVSEVHSVFEKERHLLRGISDEIWTRPELSHDEVFAHQVLTDALRERDFFVMPHYVLPTAFTAEHHISEEGGPTVCIICEYDAMGNIGHCCGHNLVATAGIAAAIAVKEVAKKDSSLAGKLRVLGTPAENNGLGKTKLLEKNAFQGVDVALAVHPASRGTFKYTSPCSCLTRITYHGRESSLLCPWEGNNAMDAAVNAYYNLAFVKRQLPLAWDISAVILTEGSETPLVLPDVCKLELFCRTPTPDDLLELQRQLRSCFLAPCHATGCMVSFDYTLPYIDFIANDVLVEVYERHAGRIGCLSRLLGRSPGGQETEFSQLATGMGNVSHAMPTLCPMFALDVQPVGQFNTEEFTNAACTSEAFERTMDAAKCLTLTALELFSSSDLVKKVKACFKEQKSTRSCLGSTVPSEVSECDGRR
ncbi:peptidase M20 domain-containing protein 2-like [Ornithodoros turicata]|uniref:peptidase M20 domain-containing protein 2-like n=1 Tax=Ornithodoros turicata TaxID=34597 RepID=UPI00313911EE